MIDAVARLLLDVGRSLLEWRTSGGTDGEWDGTQFHAKADRWAHERICSGLAAIDGAIPIVSEEDSASQQNAPHTYWLIDPIDGTASYANGFSGFVTQVALMENESPSLAVVFAPAHDELFTAERGSGAFRNGMRLSAASQDALTLIDNYPEPRGIAADAYAAFGFTRYVESGSIGLKICRVADGIASAFIKDVRVKDWDLAPPHLILTEAGGALVNGGGANIVYGLTGREHVGLAAAATPEFTARIAVWQAQRTS